MINEEALGWVVRTRDPDFADWDAFTAWLEADPVHVSAYDAMMLADGELDSILPSDPVAMPPILPVPANDPGVRPRRPLRWIGGGAIAAALVATVSIAVLNRSDIYSVSTRPGETRVIALDDGTSVALNGGTTMRFDRKDARFAALDTGEAAFTVRHDAANPFRVTVGDTVFEDAGTIFNIVHTNAATRIGVSEGKVIYNPQAEAIALPAGRALAEDAQGLRVMDIAPAAVASWRQGQLVYSNAPVTQVAEDAARSLGLTVYFTPQAQAMRFTGTIRLDRDPARFLAQAAPLMGLTAVRQGDGWLLQEGPMKEGPMKEGNGPQS
ncbi:FecR family protein [Sphingomonas bisphenolicum]|uniref:Iron dicitrate transporter FecR n=1 Tax=Sphingomonas bisphenolicum TaxID=296544 RepID=A0ABM7G642_9SPHN|nr:FecR domain-containing protein [Sphingomonas bisphenolicum]BBF70778.1 iron dicitrate transporter FecR [Sphingomonas bisphenolicum]